MDICWTYLGSCKRVSAANHVYTFHAFLRASEFIRKMWDDEMVESLIKTSPWQKKKCLVRAKRQSQRDVLRGAMRWLFHGRTMSRRFSASGRPLKTDSTLLETTLAEAKRCWKILHTYGDGEVTVSSIGRTGYSSFLGGNLIKVGGNKLTSLTS